jgi:transposase
MESTGVYWKPVYAILEGALDIVVANAQQVKKVPGRKSDKIWSSTSRPLQMPAQVCWRQQ